MKKVQGKQKAKPVKKETAPAKTETKGRVKLLANAVDFASILGVTDSQVRILTKESVLFTEPGPRGKSGAMYDVLKNAPLYHEYVRKRDEKTGSAENIQKIKMVDVGMKARLNELKVKEKEGKLHKSEDINVLFDPMITRLRINLLAIPMGIISKVTELLKAPKDAAIITEILDERIRRALDEVSEMDIIKSIEEKGYAVKDS
jgi:hypothetical protein